MRFFRELSDSVSSFQAYDEFRRQGFITTLVYLLLACLLLGSISFVPAWRSFGSQAALLSGWLRAEAPDFSLANGVFATDPETSAVYRREGELIIVIGAREGLGDSLLTGFARGVALYADRMVISGGEGQKREMRFGDYREMKVDKKEILAALDNRPLLGAFMFVFWISFYFAGKLVSALFLTGLGLNFKAFLRFNIAFGDVYKLSIRALTLGMGLDALLNLSGMDFPYFFVLYYLMAASYLWLGMKAVRDAEMTAAGLKL